MKWREGRGRRTLVPSMLMAITHNEITPGTVVVTLTGKVRMGAESEQIVNLVDELVRQGARTVIFDVAGVTHIDSTGIGRFIASYNKLTAAGGEMRMAGAGGVLYQAFHVTLLDTVFRFYPSVEEACQAEGRPSSESMSE